jgi:hypothetical protein
MSHDTDIIGHITDGPFGTGNPSQVGEIISGLIKTVS